MSESYRPGWYPDPMGRFAQRYYDGTNWTEHVVDQSGQQSSDALRSADPAPTSSSASPASSASSAGPTAAASAASGWGAPPTTGTDPSASSGGTGYAGPDPGPGPGPVAPGARSRPGEAAPSPLSGWGAPGGATEGPQTQPPVTVAPPTPPPVGAPVGPATTPVPTVAGPGTPDYGGGPGQGSPYATPGNTAMPSWATMPSANAPTTTTATSGPPMVVSLVLVLAGIVLGILSLLVLHWLSDAKFPDIARAVRDSGTDVGFLQNAYYHFGFLIALAAAAVVGLLAVFLDGPLRWIGVAVAVLAGLWHLSVLINRPEAPSGTLSYNFTPWLGLIGFALIAVGSALAPAKRREPVNRYPVNQTA